MCTLPLTPHLRAQLSMSLSRRSSRVSTSRTEQRTKIRMNIHEIVSKVVDNTKDVQAVQPEEVQQVSREGRGFPVEWWGEV